MTLSQKLSSPWYTAPVDITSIWPPVTPESKKSADKLIWNLQAIDCQLPDWVPLKCCNEIDQ